MKRNGGRASITAGAPVLFGEFSALRTTAKSAAKCACAVQEFLSSMDGIGAIADREFAYDRDSHVGKLVRGLDEGPDRGWLIVDMAHDWEQIWPNE